MRTRLLKDASGLAIGTMVSGVLAYLFFAQVTRSLGAAAAAPISVLWSYWAAAAAALTFPLQHWLIRTLAAHDDETAAARSQPVVWALTAGLAALSGLVAYAARQTLFGDPGWAYPAMVAGVTFGAALSGVVRGGLAGRGEFGATGLAIAAENAVRVAGGLIVAIAGGGPVAFGIVLVVGSLSGLLWPRSLRFTSAADAPARRMPGLLGMASGVAAASLVSQVVLTGGPVALAAAGGSPAEVTSLFVALAVWRAPYIVALGVAPRATPVLTRLSLAGDHDRLRRYQAVVVAGVVAGAAVAALLAVTIADPVLRLVFGDDVGLSALAHVLTGVGSTLAIGNMLLLLMAVAHGRSRTATAAWVVALAVGVVSVVTLPLTALLAVNTAFVAAQGVAFVLLLAAASAAAAAPPTSAEEADVTGLTPAAPL